MASLRFHKVSSLPTSGYTVGDVYYVVGQGIYVATSTTSCTKFAYANNADTNIKGVVSKSDIASVKVNSAAAADSATTATNYASTGTIATKFSTVDSSIDTINGQIGKINASVSGQTLTITKPNGDKVTFTDTDTHNPHKVTFTNGAPTNSTGNSVAVVTAANSSDTASSGDIAASTTRVNVPTLTVTNGLASRISSLETLASTGMQYKGTISSISTTDAYVAGSVYRVATNKISLITSQSATGAAITAEIGDFIVCSTAGTGTAAKWDVWQANVNNDAYWDNNTPASNQIVVADGTTGKIKTTGFTTGSFDTKGAAAGVLGASGDAAGTATVYGALAAAAAAKAAADNAQSTANSKWSPVDASTSAKGIMKVGAGLEATSGTVSVKYGTTSGTACQGNDSRLSDARTPLAHNQASDTINKMTGYAKASASAAIATTDTLNAAIGKLEYKADTTQSSLNSHTANKSNPHGVTASQVGLGNVTNNRQVVGLSNGTTAGHFVTWGADGYTVADSGYAPGSFDTKGTASGLITTLRGGSDGTLKGAYDAAANAKSIAEGKWAAVDATTTSKGIASFNSSNFAVSSGAVSLVWATWPE